MRAFLTLAVIIAIAAIAFWFASREGWIGSTEPAALMTVEERAARIEAALDAAPDAPLADREAYERLAEALPSPFSLTIGRFDEEGAGTVARDVRLTVETMPEMAVTMDRLAAYGLQPNALQPGAEGALLAERLVAAGIAFTGLEGWSDAMAQSMLEGFFGGMTDAELAAAAGEVDSYTLDAERLLVDGLVLYRLPVSEIPEDAPLALLRQMAAFSAAYGFDRAAMEGISSTSVVMQEMPAAEGEEPVFSRQDISLKAPIVLYGDYDRGDTAFTYARDFAMRQSMEVTGGTAVPQIVVTAAIESYAAEDMRLAKVLPYAAAAQFPPADETDLMSLGRWHLKGLVYGLADRPFYTVESQTVDMTSFHGLLPTRISAQTKDAWHLGAVMAFAKDSIAAAGTEEDAAQIAEVQAFLDLLEAEGLETLRLDSDFLYQWSADDGAASLAAAQRIEDVLTFDLEFAGNLPAYEALASVDAPTAEAAGEAAAALLASLSALDRASVTMTDEGGIDAALRIAIAYAETVPAEEAGQLAMLRGNQPEGIRAMAGAGLSMASAQMAAQVPAIASFAQAAAGFVMSGGTLNVAVDPEPPLTAQNAEEIGALGAQPGALIERLGLTMSHIPAEAAPQE